MTPDIALILGLVFGLLAIPSLISAWIEGRPPRVAALILVASGGAILYAFRTKEGGYSWEELPLIVYGMIADVMKAIL